VLKGMGGSHDASDLKVTVKHPSVANAIESLAQINTVNDGSESGTPLQNTPVDSLIHGLSVLRFLSSNESI